MADYQQNIERAQFLPAPPEERTLLTALYGNQEETNNFFMAREGLMPRELFQSRKPQANRGRRRVAGRPHRGRSIPVTGWGAMWGREQDKCEPPKSN